MMKRLMLVVCCVTVAGVSLVAYKHASAQTQTYNLWVPEGTPVSTSTDKLVVIGKTTGSTALTTACAPASGSYPVQSVVAVDPTGGGAARLTGIVMGPTEAAPGTRLGGLTGGQTCTDNGVVYVKYTGVVQ